MATSNLASSPQQNGHTPSTVYSTRQVGGGGIPQCRRGGIPRCRGYPPIGGYPQTSRKVYAASIIVEMQIVEAGEARYLHVTIINRGKSKGFWLRII